jgi:hypothetical protein
MNEEEEPKGEGEVNPDMLDSVFEEALIFEEEDSFFDDEDDDEEALDIAFLADDDRQW